MPPQKGPPVSRKPGLCHARLSGRKPARARPRRIQMQRLFLRSAL